MQMEAVRAIRAWVRLDAALAAYNRELKARYDVNGLQLAMLRILAERLPLRISDLRRSMAIHPATLGQAIDRLVQRGLASRAPDPRDARARLIDVSPAGRALLAVAPLAGPVRLRYVDEDTRRLADLTLGLETAVELFGLTPWAPAEDPPEPTRVGPGHGDRTS